MVLIGAEALCTVVRAHDATSLIHGAASRHQLPWLCTAHGGGHLLRGRGRRRGGRGGGRRRRRGRGGRRRGGGRGAGGRRGRRGRRRGGRWCGRGRRGVWEGAVAPVGALAHRVLRD